MSTLKYGETNYNGTSTRYNVQNDRENRHSKSSSSSKHKHKSTVNGLLRHGESSRNKSHKEDKVDIPEEMYKMKSFQDWSEQTSRAGKKYFYNCKTEVSQWEKPQEWTDYEKRLYQLLKHGAGVGASTSQQVSCDQTSTSISDAHFPGVASTSSGVVVDDQSSRSSEHRRHQRHHNQQQHYRHRNRDSPLKRDSAVVASEIKIMASTEDVASSESKRLRHDDRKAANAYANLLIDKSSSRSVHLAENCVADRGDSDRLPHLLVEIAERHKIDLADVNALEKVKRHLKAALQDPSLDDRDLSSTLGGTNSVHVNGSAVSFRCDTITEQSCKQHNEQVSNASHVNNSSPSALDTDLTPMPRFSDTHVSFYRDDLSCKVCDWAGSHFEYQAKNLADRSFQTSLEVAQVSADLKCARSLVRTAEIKSTLLDQRIGYLRKQYVQLETLNKPSVSSSSSLSLYT